MKLLGSTRSPYVQKVRIALHEKGLDYEFSQVSPATDEVARANPLAKIPTLIRDDGRGLYDSSVIIEYADGLGHAPKLIPSEFESRIEIRRWEALSDGIMDATVEISHQNRLPAEHRKGPEFDIKQQRKIDAGLARMETDFDNAKFCYGRSFSLADIACIAALLYLDRVVPELKWRERHPKLCQHFQSVSERQSVKALLSAEP